MTFQKLFRDARGRMGFAALVAGCIMVASGCSKDPSAQSIETDAHGYLCLKCDGKFYTGAREFLESKCPKCQQDTLADVTGYWCDQDHHLSIRPRISGPAGASTCDQCRQTLKNAMVSPRQEDLVTWGAVKAAPPR